MPDSLIGLGIGSEVYIFDENCRVYERKPDGRSTGGPIYRAHFRKVKITSETPKKWVTHWGSAFKKNPFQTGFFDEQGVDDAVWRNVHTYRISQAVQKADVEKLREIAKIIGYVP